MAVLMRIAELLRQQTPVLDETELASFVGSFLERRDAFLLMAKQHGSPAYVFDRARLKERARAFVASFERHVSDIRVFYAMKSNNHPLVASTLIAEGFGIDVSSGVELQQAVELGATELLFSGPGKTNEELELTLGHTDRVTILIDSFGELARLDQLAARKGGRVRAGVRLTTEESGIWRKFGIPLDRLGEFMNTADRCQNVSVCGIQFHISWNMNAENQVLFLSRLGAAIRTLPRRQRQEISFVDIGGGFWPPQGEWLQPAATPEGIIRNTISPKADSRRMHFHRPADSLDSFAEHIGRAVDKQLRPEIDCRIYMEPGRWVCNEAMHLLLTVVDRKAGDLVVTDGGINAIGWERYETDYCPIINLTRPSTTEQECLVAGSLCTPHDLWGYTYFGDDIRAGDLLLIPNQGAYTYSLRQNFIKAVPQVAVLDESRPAGGTAESARTIVNL